MLVTVTVLASTIKQQKVVPFLLDLPGGGARTDSVLNKTNDSPSPATDEREKILYFPTTSQLSSTFCHDISKEKHWRRKTIRYRENRSTSKGGDTATTHCAFIHSALSLWPAFSFPCHVKAVCTAGKS